MRRTVTGPWPQRARRSRRANDGLRCAWESSERRDRGLITSWSLLLCTGRAARGPAASFGALLEREGRWLPWLRPWPWAGVTRGSCAPVARIGAGSEPWGGTRPRALQGGLGPAWGGATQGLLASARGDPQRGSERWASNEGSVAPGSPIAGRAPHRRPGAPRQRIGSRVSGRTETVGGLPWPFGLSLRRRAGSSRTPAPCRCEAARRWSGRARPGAPARTDRRRGRAARSGRGRGRAGGALARR